jgi:hypothetical protein
MASFFDRGQNKIFRMFIKAIIQNSYRNKLSALKSSSLIDFSGF